METLSALKAKSFLLGLQGFCRSFAAPFDLLAAAVMEPLRAQQAKRPVQPAEHKEQIREQTLRRIELGISIRAYARHRGVTDTAVHKAIRTGRITALADGTIDAERADREWERNSDSPKAGTSAQASQTAQAARPPPAGPMGEAPAGAMPTGGTSLLQARTVNEVVKAQTNKVRLARLKGELVDRAQAVAHVFKLARAERDAWLNWPARISAQMAAKLEVDSHQLHIALDAAVREHLQELGEMRPRVD